MRGNYQVRFCGGRGAAMLFSPTQHPSRAAVLMLTLREQSYQEQKFTGGRQIASSAFPRLTLTATQILTAGTV